MGLLFSGSVIVARKLLACPKLASKLLLAAASRMCVYIYIIIYISIYLYIYIICTYKCICVYVYMCLYTYIFVERIAMCLPMFVPFITLSLSLSRSV